MCKPPPEIANGTIVNTTGTDVNSTTTYRCYYGYKLNGLGEIAKLTCESNGEWQPGFPKCKREYIQCRLT